MAVRVPKLKGAVFESAVIERYRRREESVEEALIDMYLAGVSTRRVDDISQAPWGERMPSQTLSDRLKKVYVRIDQWRQRPLSQPYPYAFMDGVWHKRSWGGAVENVSVPVAIGVGLDGHREVIGVAEGLTGGRDQPAELHHFPDRTGSERRADGGRRPMRRTGEHRRRTAARSPPPTPHGACHAWACSPGPAHGTPDGPPTRSKRSSPWSHANRRRPRPNRSPP